MRKQQVSFDTCCFLCIQLQIKLGFLPVRAGLFEDCAGGEAHGQRDLSRIGGAHVHAAHAAYALSDIGLHALCAYRSCGAIFIADAAADALL